MSQQVHGFRLFFDHSFEFADLAARCNNPNARYCHAKGIMKKREREAKRSGRKQSSIVFISCKQVNNAEFRNGIRTSFASSFFIGVAASGF